MPARHPARGAVASRSWAARALASLAAAALLGALAPAAAADPTNPTEQELAASREAIDSAAGKVGRAQAQLALAGAQLEAAGVAMAQAVTAYEGALYQLQQAEQAAAAARAQAEAAEADLGTQRAAVGRFAAASYRSGGDLAGVASMLGASGVQALVDRTTTLDQVSQQQSSALDKVHVAEVVSRVLRAQADAALESQRAAAEQVRQMKVEAEAQVAAQQILVGQIAATRDQATADLASAKTTNKALEQARRDALAQEAARQAAEAAAKRAAEQAAARARASTTPASTGSGVYGSTGDRPTAAPAWSPSLTGGVSTGTEEGAATAIAFARAQMGKPYVWAADGPDSYDCSGLTMRAWEAGGVALPHYSVAQFAQAKKIPATQARPGDLVFFGSDPTDAGTIYHVGLYIGAGMMIEAPYTGSWVRESSINRPSLFGFARP